MPEMDGYELCAHIKSQDHLKDIPIMLLTALSDPEDVIKALVSGANNFISKPYDENALLSRMLVEIMGGRIWTESEVGEGSTFSFTAKFEIQSGKEPVQNPDMDITGAKTLIVDDNATNRMVLSEMISQWGAQVTEKEDGKRGLDEMRRAANEGKPYTLVLLDYSMPGLDGYQVAEIIKKDKLLATIEEHALKIGD
jgi:CheY-like chemotaxis protein